MIDRDPAAQANAHNRVPSPETQGRLGHIRYDGNGKVRRSLLGESGANFVLPKGTLYVGSAGEQLFTTVQELSQEMTDGQVSLPSDRTSLPDIPFSNLFDATVTDEAGKPAEFVLVYDPDHTHRASNKAEIVLPAAIVATRELSREDLEAMRASFPDVPLLDVNNQLVDSVGGQERREMQRERAARKLGGGSLHAATVRRGRELVDNQIAELRGNNYEPVDPFAASPRTRYPRTNRRRQEPLSSEAQRSVPITEHYGVTEVQADEEALVAADSLDDDSGTSRTWTSESGKMHFDHTPGEIRVIKGPLIIDGDFHIGAEIHHHYDL